MRYFSKVSPLIWRQKQFRALRSTEARLLYLYFLTSGHQSSAGAYYLPDNYPIGDVDMSEADYHEAKADIIRSGAIVYDDDTSEIFITDWFETNPAMNDKHAVRIRREIAKIESDALREAVEAAFISADANRIPDQIKAAKKSIVETFARADTGSNNAHLTQTPYLGRRAV